MKAIIRGLGFALLSAVALVAFGGQDPAVETRTFKLVYATASEMAERLNNQMCRELGQNGQPFRVATAYESVNAVSVTASPATVKACAEIIADIDVKPKQVYVEARFVSLSSSAARNLGLKWNMLQKGIGIERANVAGAMTYQHIPDGVSSYKENYTKGRNSGFTSEATYNLADKAKLPGGWMDTSYFQGTISSSDMSLLLQAFDDDASLKTFANPKIIVSSGKEATVDMAIKRPYVELSARRVVEDQSNILHVDAKMSPIPGTDATFSGDVFFSFGIELKVLPRVLTNGLVNVVITPAITTHDLSADVTLRPSVTEVDDSDAFSADIPHVTYPGVDMQRIITEFTMKSGETAVIGGLTHTEEVDAEDGIPYLRAIPWIGKWLFGSTTKVKTQEDILVFVTVGEVDPEGVKGTTGAPAASTAAKKYPEGLNTKLNTKSE